MERVLRGRRPLAIAVVAILLVGLMVTTGRRAGAAAYSGFDWEDGSVQGWSEDWDGVDPKVSSDRAFSGSSSLAIRLEGEQYAGYRSPAGMTGIGVGSVVTYYVYAPVGIPTGLRIVPYVVDGSYDEHFAAKHTLTPGAWTPVSWTVPSIDTLRYVGLEIDDPGWTGTVNLDSVSWTPPTDLPPVVTTKPATSVGSTTAVLNGTVDPSGLATTCRFEYGTTRKYGKTVPVPEPDGAVAARITGLTQGATYHFRLSCQNSGGLRTGADRSFLTVGDPRGELFEAKNLIYGSHIGAWDMDGGTAVKDETAVANVKAARVRVIKWQMWKPPCDLRPDDCQTTAQFNAGIDGIRSLGAEPLVGLPPIWDKQCAGAADAWSAEWQQWIIRTAGSRVRLYEMGNEPDNYCGMSGQQYHDDLWVQAPVVKAYARSLGLRIFVGGPGWAMSEETAQVQVQEWLAAAKASYLAHDRNRDWLPDFVSTHTYLKTPSENDTQEHAQARIDSWRGFYTDLRHYIDTTFAGLTDNGYPIAEELRLADTEWNATIDNDWTGNDSQEWTDYYYRAMFTMLRDSGVWLSNQSTIASHTGGALDLLKPDGTPKPSYTSYKSLSTTDPHN